MKRLIKAVERFRAKNIGCAFIDQIDHREVFYFERKDKSKFLANSNFSSIFCYMDVEEAV